MPNFTKNTRLTLVTLLIFFNIAQVHSQASTDSSYAHKSYFKTSLSYLSDNVYNGRKDSAKVPYLIPTFGYYNKTGFYAEAAPSFLSKAGAMRLDLFTVTAGYDYTSKNQSFSTGAYFSKYFYDNNSTSVKSIITGDAGAYVGYDFGPVMLSGGADYLAGKKSDVLTNIALSHTFYIGTNDYFSVAPEVMLNAGTQNFYKEYNSKKHPRIASALSSESKFSALDYEFSAPVAYDAGKWGAWFTPTYALPMNPIIVTNRTGEIAYRQHLENTLFAEVGAYIKF
jgi:hypothetical protein